MTEEQILFAKHLKRNTNGLQKRPVRCIDTGRVYGSSSDASDIISFDGILINPRNILLVCQGKQKSTGGFRWEYADTDNDPKS